MGANRSELLRKLQTLGPGGNAQEVSAAYRALLEAEPKSADTWADYAGHLLRQGDLDEAQKACEAALDLNPQQPSALINLGCTMVQRNRWDEAEWQFRTALHQDSRRIDAQLFLVECLLHKRDFERTRKALEEADLPGAMAGAYAVLQPRLAELWAELGAALLRVERHEEGEVACLRALRLAPRHVRAMTDLGSIKMAQGHLEEAEGLFRDLLQDHPNDESARLLLITCLTRKGEVGLADLEITRVLQQEPTDLLVHSRVGGVYYNLGRWVEFKDEIDRFRKVDPASLYPDYEESFLDLLQGDMPRGWERYETRLRLPKAWWPQRSFSQPAWTGEPFDGKTLLLWPEQGLGDILMFVRYLPLVKALGGRVVLEAPRPLLDLVATCEGADVVVPFGAALPPFDLQSSLLSLPWVFRTELSSIPADVPYLCPPEVVPHRRALQEQLVPAEGSTRIGLVWAGSPENSRNFERSLPPAAYAPLAVIPGVTWFSFQVGKPELPPLPNLVTLAPLLGNFSDTAYALSTMDLVITVDTCVAHLAGALGVPTLLLLAFQADFRWLLKRNDSPWYPTMRLYRQPAFGDWDSVIQQVLSDLTQDA